MQIFYCRDSELDARPGDFLIYGGLVLDGVHAPALSRAVDDIRERAHIGHSFRLGFNARPEDRSQEEFAALKQKLIEAAVSHGAKLIASVILHDVAKNPDAARCSGLVSAYRQFDRLLDRFQGPGLMLIERCDDGGARIAAHLIHKFSTGSSGLPYSPEIRLYNLPDHHYTAYGQSHFPSLVDMAIGSLRVALNACTASVQANIDTARYHLGLVAPMFYREPDEARISEVSLLVGRGALQPGQYRAQYQSLRDFLAQAGIDMVQ